jgi:hypothetical protein
MNLNDLTEITKTIGRYIFFGYKNFDISNRYDTIFNEILCYKGYNEATDYDGLRHIFNYF